MTHQFELMKAQETSQTMFRDALSVENQHFFPFYFLQTFYINKYGSTGERIRCASCGEPIDGNYAGYYTGSVLIVEKGAIPTCYCTSSCMRMGVAAGTHIWKYEDQRHGQPKPLTLQPDASLEMRMIWELFFTHKQSRYRIMKYKKIDFEIFKEVCDPGESHGCTYRGPEAKFIYYHEQKLEISNTTCFADPNPVCSITSAGIVKTINEMLYNMRFKQLSLF